MKRQIALVLTLVAALAVAVAPALAGKGGGTTSPPPDIAIASINGTSLATATVKPAPKLGDKLLFATVNGTMAGWEYPMVVSSCYQDVNGDGKVDTSSVYSTDLVYAEVNHPDATFILGQFQSDWTRRGGAATCRADLDAYGWKQGKETIRLMASTGDYPAGG